MPNTQNPLHKPGQGQVSTKFPDGHENIVQQQFPSVDGALAEIGYELGHTMNLGNFESLKMTVSIRLPALPTVTSLNLVFGEAKEWVEDKLSQVVAEANQQKGSKAS